MVKCCECILPYEGHETFKKNLSIPQGTLLPTLWSPEESRWWSLELQALLFSLLDLIILCYDCSFALALYFSPLEQECPLGPNMLEVRSWECRVKRLETIKVSWHLRTGGLLKQTVVMCTEVKNQRPCTRVARTLALNICD